jgi:hypothetical protein
MLLLRELVVTPKTHHQYLYHYVAFRLGPLAQSVEQRTFNPWVVGSSPTGPTLTEDVIRRPLLLTWMNQGIRLKWFRIPLKFTLSAFSFAQASLAIR